MQLIRKKLVRGKACIKARCYFHSVMKEILVPQLACPSAHPTRGWREAGTSRATVLLPPATRACRSHTLTVRRNAPIVEPLVLPHCASVPALWCQIAHLGLEA